MDKRELLILSWVISGIVLFAFGTYKRSTVPENASRAWTETCNWIGATGGAWETATNWDCTGVNRVPTNTDQVVIDASVTVNINATTTIDNLVLGDAAGTYSPILNFNYDAITNGALIIDDSNAIVYANASITHTVGTTVVVGKTYINVQTGNFTLNGSINVTGKGYAASEGTGQGMNGGDATGAGYGGEGGNTSYGVTGGGITYGSLTAPTDLGSGGGIASTAGAGGGAVQLTVTGTTTLSGTISADGVASGSAGDGGGGSGGSVYITTGTLAGASTVTANGMAGYRFGGAGGGGRIAVYYTTDSSTVTYQAYGGTGNIGAAGTIYKKPAAGNGDVIVNNGDRNPADRKTGDLSAGITLNSLEEKNYGRIHLTGTSTITTITLSGTATLQLEATANLTATTLTWGTSSSILDRGVSGSNPISGGGTLTVPTTTTLYADTARSYSSVTVNGTITTSNNTTAETYKLNYTVSSDVLINSGGSINVSSKGYASTEGTGQGTDSATGSGGGAYGGNGGAGLSVAGGTAYGSSTAPIDIGSGGGQDGVGNGGKGGGAAIMAITGTLQVDGSILADGGNYVALDSGGGAGGSIYITTAALSGSGTIYARGGNGLVGKGGGGRIAILYTGWSWVGNTMTDAVATSGGTGYSTGSVGTVYLASSNELPSASNVLIDSGALGVNLTAGSTASVSCTATITDLDGYLDISNVSATFYRTSIGYAAANDDNNHYSANCSGGSGSGTTQPFTCLYSIWFHADGTDADSPNPSDDWTCRVTPSDSDGEGTSATDAIEMNSISALEISVSSINFAGDYIPGENTGSTNEITTLSNAGNIPIDVEISGDPMCTDYPTCAGTTIPVGNLEYTDIAFTYGDGIDLSGTPVLNAYNIAKSTAHPSSQSRSAYWGVGIPSAIQNGVYTGGVLFTALGH